MDSGIGKCIDRISSLPDGVLGHILSFLPTKYAVRTSILAKRWENLWTYITILDFHELELLGSFNGDEEKVGKWFVRFVNQVLHRSRAPCLHKFLLDITTFEATESVDTWVSAAIMRNVRELELCITYEYLIHVPPLIFGSRTLESLFLDGVNLKVPDQVQVWLPSLKVAHFGDIEDGNKNSLTKFLAGCPVLEELQLRRNYFANQPVFVISVPTLKHLQIECYAEDVDHITDVQTGQWGEIVLDAPKLEFLQIWDHYLDDFNFKNLSSLSQADIYLARISSLPNDEGRPIYKLLTGLSHVKSLSAHFFSHPDVNGYELSTFGNLTKLDLGTQNSKLIADILRCSPNLVVLILEAYISSWRAPERVPDCLVSKLKNVRIEGCSGDDNELPLIEYLLKNSNVLEKMEIDCTEASDDLTEILACLPKGSNACQLRLLQNEESLMREGVFIF